MGWLSVVGNIVGVLVSKGVTAWKVATISKGKIRVAKKVLVAELEELGQRVEQRFVWGRKYSKKEFLDVLYEEIERSQSNSVTDRVVKDIIFTFAPLDDV